MFLLIIYLLFYPVPFYYLKFVVLLSDLFNITLFLYDNLIIELDI